MANYNDIFKIKHNNRLPEKGKVLISEPFLREVFFHRSVVLLIEHNEKGSMGFVLNKKLDLQLNDFFDGMEKIPRIPLYLGGPVSADRLFFIHSLGNVIPDSVQVGENLYYDGDFESMSYYLLSGQPNYEKIKFFLGYSGWTNNQLVNEIKQDSWLVGQISNRDLLITDGELLWRRAIKTIGGSYLTWLNYPKDPLLN